jgi:hypothetical protein
MKRDVGSGRTGKRACADCCKTSAIGSELPRHLGSASEQLLHAPRLSRAKHIRHRAVSALRLFSTLLSATDSTLSPQASHDLSVQCIYLSKC